MVAESNQYGVRFARSLSESGQPGIAPPLIHSRRSGQIVRILLGQNDGPMLDALKRLKGATIHLPGRVKDRPDRERLALRFERFKAVA